MISEEHMEPIAGVLSQVSGAILTAVHPTAAGGCVGEDPHSECSDGGAPTDAHLGSSLGN